MKSLVLPVTWAWLFFLQLAVEWLFLTDDLLNIGSMLTTGMPYHYKIVKTVFCNLPYVIWKLLSQDPVSDTAIKTRNPTIYWIFDKWGRNEPEAPAHSEFTVCQSSWCVPTWRLEMWLLLRWKHLTSSRRWHLMCLYRKWAVVAEVQVTPFIAVLGFSAEVRGKSLLSNAVMTEPSLGSGVLHYLSFRIQYSGFKRLEAAL